MKDYHLTATADGSITLYDERYREAMHSTSGAYEEAILKHVHPSGLLKSEKSELNVLDIGFGLGYNSLALMTELRRINYCGVVTIESFELERNYSSVMKDIRFSDDRDAVYDMIKRAYDNGTDTLEKITLWIHFGDARHTIGLHKKKEYDAVFHDPYSPSKNPELWTVQFFRRIYSLMANDAMLTTYSSAPQVRGALLQAGFTVGRGPAVGLKKEGTLAGKNFFTEKLSESEIASLLANYRSTPYFDDCNDSREKIIERRLKEMTEKRQSMSSSSSSTDRSL